jgi:fructosamine-3-kinase
VRHPLLDPEVVHAVRRAAAEHLGRAWIDVGFTGLNHRASHPCGIFTGTPFSVFAKLDAAPSGQEQLTAELNGLRLIHVRTAVATPVPVGAGVVVTRAGTLLLTEAVAERGASSGQAADGRTPEDYFAPAAPALLRGYAEIAPLDPGFAGRRELWRLHAYLAVVAVDGANPFGSSFLARIADAVRQYA